MDGWVSTVALRDLKIGLRVIDWIFDTFFNITFLNGVLRIGLYYFDKEWDYDPSIHVVC